MKELYAHWRKVRLPGSSGCASSFVFSWRAKTPAASIRIGASSAISNSTFASMEPSPSVIALGRCHSAPAKSDLVPRASSATKVRQKRVGHLWRLHEVARRRGVDGNALRELEGLAQMRAILASSCASSRRRTSGTRS